MYHYGLYKEVPYGLENTAVIFAFCHMLVLTFHTQNKEKHMPWQTIITNINSKPTSIFSGLIHTAYQCQEKIG